MPTYSSKESAQMLALALFDDDPLVRLGVAQSLNNLDPGYRFSYGKHLLTDPVLAVRIETARALAPIAGQLQGDDLALLNNGLAEYITAQLVNADRPEAQVNLGTLYGIQGQSDKAEQAFKTAISLQKNFVPAYINLADMYRAIGEEAKSDATLRQALNIAPDSAVVAHSLSLSLIRQKKNNDALEMLALAVKLEPYNSRYRYIYAVALNSFVLPDLAITVLKTGLTQEPDNRDMLGFVITLYQQQGKHQLALEKTRELVRLYPNDQQERQLLQQLESADISN